MTEDLTNIYDIYRPSPPSLKQLASISVALELWRREINEHRESNTLHKLILRKKISSSVLEPLLPSSIFNDIDDWTKKVGKSIDRWLDVGCEALLDFHRDDPNEILRDFDDFVCEIDGTIHLARTAKRMMLCDGFSIDEKFKIACMHCLEEDAVRLWPSLRTELNLDDIDFHKHGVLYYWICRMTDDLQKIRGFTFDADDSPELKMLRFHRCGWTAAGYFLHRLNPEHRWKGAVNLAHCNPLTFCRYVLAKLNEKELDKVMSYCDGESMLPEFLKSKEVWIILPTWTFIKHKLRCSGILRIIRLIFKRETENSPFLPIWDASVSLGIWRSISDELKQYVIRKLLPDSSLFEKDDVRMHSFRVVSFLLEVLSDTPSEGRAAFWRYNWRNLIIDCRAEDLYSLMKLCFDEENEIMQFKESTLSKYNNIGPSCSRLLREGYFEELNDLIDFCCPTKQAGKSIKRNLLMNDLAIWETSIFHKIELLDEFVKDTFGDNVDVMDKFKIQLVLSFDEIEIVNRVLLGGHYQSLMNFYDRFVTSKGITVHFNKRYFPHGLKSILAEFRLPLAIEGNDLSEFMQWSFENNECDIAKFKKTLVMDELIPNIIRGELLRAGERSLSSAKRRKDPFEPPYMLDKLLEWYFDTPQAVENFKVKWADVFELLSQ